LDGGGPGRYIPRSVVHGVRSPWRGEGEGGRAGLVERGGEAACLRRGDMFWREVSVASVKGWRAWSRPVAPASCSTEVPQRCSAVCVQESSGRGLSMHGWSGGGLLVHFLIVTVTGMECGAASVDVSVVTCTSAVGGRRAAGVGGVHGRVVEEGEKVIVRRHGRWQACRPSST
jgi:hypothetical protein